VDVTLSSPAEVGAGTAAAAPAAAAVSAAFVLRVAPVNHAPEVSFFGGAASCGAGWSQPVGTSAPTRAPARAPPSAAELASPRFDSVEDADLLVGSLCVADADTPKGRVSVVVSALHGSLALPALVGGEWRTPPLPAARTASVVGTLAQANAALARLAYRPDRDFNGEDELCIAATDDGQLPGAAAGEEGGSGATARPLTTRLCAVIAVAPLNDRPTVSWAGAASGL